MLFASVVAMLLALSSLVLGTYALDVRARYRRAIAQRRDAVREARHWREVARESMRQQRDHLTACTTPYRGAA